MSGGSSSTPEALGIAQNGADGLAAVGEHVEYLGHETLAHTRVDARPEPIRLVARLLGMSALRTENRIRLSFPAEAVQSVR
jgi:hypothetical protein